MKNYIWVSLIAMIPVAELRAAIPVGCSLGMPAWQTYAAAVVGNMIPVPLIILFTRSVVKFIRTHWQKLDSLVNRLEANAMKKADRVMRYEILGLWLFVAIPLPGTGAWTGAMIAALLNIRMRRSLPTIFLGVLTAGVIMTLVSYGISLGIETIGG